MPVPAGARAPATSDTGPLIRRPERADDDALLFDLFCAVHGGALAGLDPALADLLLNRQFAGQATSYRAAFPAARLEVVEVDGRPVGRVVTDAADGALRLVDLVLLPEWRGRGIGTRLLRALQAEARDATVPLRLSVLNDNAAARRLYERLGFRAFDATESHLALQWCP